MLAGSLREEEVALLAGCCKNCWDMPIAKSMLLSNISLLFTT